MRLIISLILAALMVSCATPPARSQSTYQVVATCGTPPVTLSAGAVRTGYMDTSGQICSVAAAGAGGATAANQVLQLAQETAINTVLGLQADSACATDNGTCTIAALAKRGNQRLTTINTTLGTPMQATGGTVGLVAGVAEIGNVKNSGTFAVQATLTAETTKVIGTVNQGTSPWAISGAVTNAGTFAVQATLSAETTKVIGTVNQGTSPWVISGAVTNAGTFATQSAVTAASGSYASGAFASGSFASGSHASGSFASGAFASGSVASGAYASGSLASGSMVDLVALSAPVAPATATATKSALLGAQATTGAVNPTNGQQGALSSDTNNNLLVSAGGAPNIATAQASVTTGNISIASARPLRRAITITNVTGTSAVYCGNTGVTTSTGTYLGATAGSSITLNTTAAVFCTVASVTQTVTAAETY